MVENPTDLRTLLQEVGLTQSGFARTLVAWGDPRSFEVVLRWVQRAVAGADDVPYVKVVTRILQGHVDQRKNLCRRLERLESGTGQIWQGSDGISENITNEIIYETRRQIEELDKLLAECKNRSPIKPIK